MKQEKNKQSADKMLDILGVLLGGGLPDKIFVCTDEEQVDDLNTILRRPSSLPMGKIIEVDFSNKRRI